MIEIFERFQTPSQVELMSTMSTRSSPALNRGNSADSDHRRNPTIHVFIYSRTANADALPTPGYWTSFKLIESNSEAPQKGDE